MKSLRAKAPGSAGRWMGMIAGLAIVAMPAAALAASAADLYYERTVMTAADARCGLFAAPVGSALAAAQAQARGAALRAGVEADALHEINRKARAKVGAVACDSRDIALAAGRVRTAFEGYAKLIRMSYPGDVSEWKADRSVSRENALWRLSQPVKFGWDKMIFGLAGREGPGVLLASASFADGQAPFGARLVMRDTSRLSRPYLDRRAAGADGRIPLAARTPPKAMTRAFSAEARSPAGESLLPAGSKNGWSFRFPKAAAEALAELDPREAVAVEFVFAGRSGDEVRRAYVEVGDFAAGRAFLQTAQR